MIIKEIKKVVIWQNTRFGYYGKKVTIITAFFHDKLPNGATTKFEKFTIKAV